MANLTLKKKLKNRRSHTRKQGYTNKDLTSVNLKQNGGADCPATVAIMVIEETIDVIRFVVINTSNGNPSARYYSSENNAYVLTCDNYADIATDQTHQYLIDIYEDDETKFSNYINTALITNNQETIDSIVAGFIIAFNNITKTYNLVKLEIDNGNKLTQKRIPFEFGKVVNPGNIDHLKHELILPIQANNNSGIQQASSLVPPIILPNLPRARLSEPPKYREKYLNPRTHNYTFSETALQESETAASQPSKTDAYQTSETDASQPSKTDASPRKNIKIQSLGSYLSKVAIQYVDYRKHKKEDARNKINHIKQWLVTDGKKYMLKSNVGLKKCNIHKSIDINFNSDETVKNVFRANTEAIKNMTQTQEKKYRCTKQNNDIPTGINGMNNGKIEIIKYEELNTNLGIPSNLQESQAGGKTIKKRKSYHRRQTIKQHPRQL